MDDSIYTSSSRGHLTPVLTLDEIVEQIVVFVQRQLPLWCDDPDRSSQQREDTLNSELCDFLNARARHDFQMVRFHHQQGEEIGKRSTDFSAKPADSVWFAEDYYSIYKPLTVFEGKRLPAPTTNREYEYVTDLNKVKGGIQRFKMGAHGSQCTTGVLIGYIQKETPAFWHDKINGWINELAAGSLVDGQSWSEIEHLKDYKEDGNLRTSSSHSEHSRPNHCVSQSVQLHHLWIVMIAS